MNLQNDDANCGACSNGCISSCQNGGCALSMRAQYGDFDYEAPYVFPGNYVQSLQVPTLIEYVASTKDSMILMESYIDLVTCMCEFLQIARMASLCSLNLQRMLPPM